MSTDTLLDALGSVFGALCMLLGFFLIVRGIGGEDSESSVRLIGMEIRTSRVGPGVIFALFGLVLTIFAISRLPASQNAEAMARRAAAAAQPASAAAILAPAGAPTPETITVPPTLPPNISMISKDLSPNEPRLNPHNSPGSSCGVIVDRAEYKLRLSGGHNNKVYFEVSSGAPSSPIGIQNGASGPLNIGQVVIHTGPQAAVSTLSAVATDDEGRTARLALLNWTLDRQNCVDSELIVESVAVAIVQQ